MKELFALMMKVAEDQQKKLEETILILSKLSGVMSDQVCEAAASGARHTMEQSTQSAAKALATVSAPMLSKLDGVANQRLAAGIGGPVDPAMAIKARLLQMAEPVRERLRLDAALELYRPAEAVVARIDANHLGAILMDHAVMRLDWIIRGSETSEKTSNALNHAGLWCSAGAMSDGWASEPPRYAPRWRILDWSRGAGEARRPDPYQRLRGRLCVALAKNQGDGWTNTKTKLEYGIPYGY